MWKRLMLGWVVVLIAACGTITTDVDKQADFSLYQTFEFGAQGGAAASIDAQRIELAVATELRRQGLRQVPSGGDIYVHHYIVKSSEFVSVGSSFSFGHSWNSFGVLASSPDRYRERRYGNLVIELVDIKENQVVWKGMSSRRLTESMDTASRESLIAEEVVKMFENYPYGDK